MNAIDRTPDDERTLIAEYLIARKGDYIVEALERHRAQDPSQRVFIAVAILFPGLFALSLWPFDTKDLVAIAAVCAAMFALPIVTYRIQYWALRRRFRNLPEGLGTFRVSVGPDGVFSRSASLEPQSGWSASAAPWSAYERAVPLPDGILLYRAAEGVQWLPDAALVEGSRDDVEQLFRAHLPSGVSRARRRVKHP
jgi:hypothetical protein